VTFLVALLLAAPVLETFDEALDPLRWYVGVPKPPKGGVLQVPKDGWIVSRGIADDRIERLEVVFRQRGGRLQVTLHDPMEPLSSPVGDPVDVPRGKGARTLVIDRRRAEVDGEAFPFGGALRGTFALRAVAGAVEILEVRVAPRVGAVDPLAELERNTIHFATTPPLYRTGGESYVRASLMLWDVEVSFLFRRGPSGVSPLQAPPKGSPLLGVLLTAGYGRELAGRAASHPLAMNDWGDERGNLSEEDFKSYVTGEYALFDLILQAQRAMNAAIPERKELESLAHLAVVRHTENAHAAFALAETQGARGALAALKRELGREDPRRASPDRLRSAASAAARRILGEPPGEWPGFRFEPGNRYVTIQQARDLLR